MASWTRTMKVAVVQMLVGKDKAANVRTAVSRIAEAARNGAGLVVLPVDNLPEPCSESRSVSIRHTAPSSSSSTASRLRAGRPAGCWPRQPNRTASTWWVGRSQRPRLTANCTIPARHTDLEAICWQSTERWDQPLGELLMTSTIRCICLTLTFRARSHSGRARL